MRIISHRGLWREPGERNDLTSFERSFAAGFGTELDVRDHAGEVVVAHDPPGGTEPLLEQVLALHAALGPGLPLAVNVKADGLQQPLARLLADVHDAFVFDMSIPDTLGYLRAGLPVFMRQSEHERDVVLAERASGVWVDGFDGEWFDEGVLRQHTAAGRRVCLVSPELHGRDHVLAWKTWSRWATVDSHLVMLCTDHPFDAQGAFH